MEPRFEPEFRAFKVYYVVYADQNFCLTHHGEYMELVEIGVGWLSCFLYLKKKRTIIFSSWRVCYRKIR